MRSPALLCTLALPLLACAPSAEAAVTLDTSGGSGAPVTVTLLSPITFTITVQQGVSAPIFVFDGFGADFGGSVTGSITYSVNGGPAKAINYMGYGYANNDMTEDDMYLYGDFVALNLGDTVVLSAGSLTTSDIMESSVPTDTSSSVFIAQDFGLRISDTAAVVPEPSSALLLGLGGAGFFLRRRRAA